MPPTSTRPTLGSFSSSRGRLPKPNLIYQYLASDTYLKDVSHNPIPGFRAMGSAFDAPGQPNHFEQPTMHSSTEPNGLDQRRPSGMSASGTLETCWTGPAMSALSSNPDGICSVVLFRL